MLQKPKYQGSSWLVTSVLILVIAIFSLTSYLLLDNSVRHQYEERLRSQVFAFRHDVVRWVNNHEKIMKHVVRQSDLASNLEQLANPDCMADCREVASTELQYTLIATSQLFSGDDSTEKTYQANAYILSNDDEILASSEQLSDGKKSLLIGLLRQEESRVEGFRMPRRPPVGFDGKSSLSEPLVLFVQNIPGPGGNLRHTLVVTLLASEAFSELVSGVEGSNLMGESTPAIEDSYAFNQQGVLVTIPAQSKKLLDSQLVKSDQLILNLSLRDPGGDLTSGYRSTLVRDDQPYTRLVLSAIVGESGVDTTGYRNYLGVPVFGAWLWDEQLGMGFAVEIEESIALSEIKNVQWFIVLLGLIASLGLIWSRLQWIGSQRLVQEEADISRRKSEAQLSELKMALDAAVARQENGQLELQTEVGERKKLFDQSRSAIELHRSLMDISQDGILIVKHGNRLVDFNGCFIQMWDLDLNVKQGAARDLEQIVYRGMALQLKKEIDGLNILNDWLAQGDPGEPHEVPEILNLVNGRKLRLLSLPLLASEEGEQGVHGRLLVFRDVDGSERSHFASDAMTVNLQKLLCVEILARGVSHEFNNILAAVFGYTELVQRFIDPESDVAEYVSELLDAAKRVQVLVQSFLSFSRHSGEEQEWVEVDALLDQVLQLMAEVVPPGITIMRASPTEAIQIHVRAQRVSQVLLITLFDTVKKLSFGGELHISCVELTENRVDIKISAIPQAGEGRSVPPQKRAFLESFSGLEDHYDAISALMEEENGAFEITKDIDDHEICVLSFSMPD